MGVGAYDSKELAVKAVTRYFDKDGSHIGQAWRDMDNEEFNKYFVCYGAEKLADTDRLQTLVAYKRGEEAVTFEVKMIEKNLEVFLVEDEEVFDEEDEDLEDTKEEEDLEDSKEEEVLEDTEEEEVLEDTKEEEEEEDLEDTKEEEVLEDTEEEEVLEDTKEEEELGETTDDSHFDEDSE